MKLLQQFGKNIFISVFQIFIATSIKFSSSFKCKFLFPAAVLAETGLPIYLEQKKKNFMAIFESLINNKSRSILQNIRQFIRTPKLIPVVFVLLKKPKILSFMYNILQFKLGGDTLEN